MALPLTRREFFPLVGALGAAALQTAAGAEKGQGTRIRVGQIGTGHAHASKLSVFRRSPDYEVVGLVEPDPELRAKAEKQEPYRGVPLMTQEQLLEQPGLQLVLVETKVQDLLETAQACVAAGKHIHMDKPAGDDLSQLRQLLHAAEQKKLLVQMGYMYRYSPAVVLLRSLLGKGVLGVVFDVEAVMSKVVGPADRLRHVWHPGGMMLELGCHLMDLVVAILGAPSEVHPVLQHVSPIGDGLMDNTLAVLKYPKATATVRASALEVEGGDRRHLTVCGTEGTFHIQPLDKPRVRLSLSKARDGYQAGTQDIDVGPYERYVDDAADIARVIRGEKPALMSYAHDLTVQETLFRACGLKT